MPKVSDSRKKEEIKRTCKWCEKPITLTDLYAWGTGNDGPLCETCWFHWRKTGERSA
jgi:hypothetical protein